MWSSLKVKISILLDCFCFTGFCLLFAFLFGILLIITDSLSSELVSSESSDCLALDTTVCCAGLTEDLACLGFLLDNGRGSTFLEIRGFNLARGFFPEKPAPLEGLVWMAEGGLWGSEAQPTRLPSPSL